ncbi:MAG: FAD binding domain-containing protein [Spirochaetia bacterium]|uniref:FAD binding domain-containing protein n=1 Tax=Treponema berlinense TaxID=225004 RepID=UPI0026EA090B|nr:FAD binding domain-containing protein [Treponema berlinense]MDD5789274.1 FAD binding domain-containing protein [Spirochaetia bacterium]
MSKTRQIYYAKTLNEIFYQKKSVKDIQLIGGCTQDKKMPEISLCVRNIRELNYSIKHERFFEFGPEITLSQILEIDPSKLPSVFFEAVKSIANRNIRNIATLAGNICAKNYRHTLFAPLTALDARLELKSETETVYLPMTKFTEIPEKFVLSKVILPLDDWEVAVFKRLGPAHLITENSASFVFLANTLKNQISNLKIAFAGPFSIRSLELENRLLGAYLPLSENTILEFEEAAAKLYDETYETCQDKKVPAILRSQFLNLVKYSLEQLT